MLLLEHSSADRKQAPPRSFTFDPWISGATLLLRKDNIMITDLTARLRLLAQAAQSDSGQDLIEYALIAALIGVACIASMGDLATGITTAFSNLGNSL